MSLPDPEYAAAPDEPFDLPDLGPVLGTVVEVGRGALPFSLIHGEALVACAAWALGDAGVHLIDEGTTWAAVVEAEEPVVLHDPLCPMTPAWFVSRCVETASERGVVAVGVRPVTDTVKRLDPAGGEDAALVGETLDRSGMWSLASPIVLPAQIAATLTEWPAPDFVALVADLTRRVPVVALEAPPEGRRVTSPDEIRLLEALTTR